MQFFKDFFNHNKTVIGLSGIRKKEEYVRVTIPETYKTTFVTNVEKNYLLL